MKNKKILFYTANGVGLGHLRRTSLIAESIKEIEPNAKIFFVTMCPRVVFLDALEISYKKISPITDKMLVEENYQEFKKAKTRNELVLKKAIQEFKPSVIVADIHCFVNFSFPQSILLPEFTRIKKILIFRKGDKTSFVKLLKNYQSKKGYQDSIIEKFDSKALNQVLPMRLFVGLDKLNLFDKIILPHTEKKLKKVLPKSVLKKTKRDSKFVFAGPIFRKINKKEIKACREKHNIAEKDFLVTCILGGGGELVYGKCESVVGLAISLLKNIEKILKIKANIKVIIVTGPLFKYTKILAEFPSVKKKIVRIVQYEESLLELMRLSKLIITPVGYNAGNEIIEARTPALLYPLVRGDQEEQQERARQFELLGIAKVLRSPQPDKLARVIKECIREREKMQKQFEKLPKPKSGNKKAARKILLTA